MGEPSPGGALDAETTRRLLAVACDSIRGFEAELIRSRTEAGRLRDSLAAIHSSRGWAFLQRYYRLRNKLLPPGGRAKSFARWAAGARHRAAAPPADAGPYQRWIARHEAAAFARWPASPAAAGDAPHIHLLLTGAGPSLDESVRSVLAQTDLNWSLWVVTAGPFRSEDPRITVVEPPASGAVADAWNGALAQVEDGFVAVLHAGDLLAPVCVAVLRHALAAEPRAGMIYSDEDALDDAGERCNPLFKPDWSPETFRAADYVGRLVAYSLPIVREVGGFRPEFGEAAGYDLGLRVSEKAGCVRHLPAVLYHIRRAGAARSGDGVRAVQAHLDRIGVLAEVRPGSTPGVQEVRYRVGRPLTSIVIPSRDQPRLLGRCVESILSGEYPSQEILIVDTGSVTAEARAVNSRLAAQRGVRLLSWDRPFNYAAVNNYAAAQAKGESLAFVNDDTELITPDWLDRLNEHALRPEVGAVGAKLLYPGGTVQHAGVIVGITEQACGHYLVGQPGDAPGYARRLVAVQNLSAVTGACLVMRRAVFEEVGGFDERFAGDYNDVDLCLRVRQRGYQVIWTPHARLVHYQCQTRGTIDNPARHAQFVLERLLFLDRWGELVARGDPYYSPHLTHDGEECSIATEPRP